MNMPTPVVAPAPLGARRHLLRVAAVLPLAAVLAGCALPVSRVDSGSALVAERLTLEVTQVWNQFPAFGEERPPTWTQHGLTVDTLRFYVGLKDGALLAPTPSKPEGTKPLVFKSPMQPADVVALFEALTARDGSSFTLDRIEPQPFLGGNGFRFEYSVVRKYDEVRLKGVAWGAVRNGELFVIDYSAPRLGFFDRARPAVERMAQSARLKG
jgi:hypothetical protein